uniref:uncharacterized protein LOC122594498 n=1 Tax=Erigeron canadensis TaxID=72917 RepID=UPI001CB98FFF|nr:uncharacterized protein LOC122594498 [Erigeron canadensis]
MEVISINTQQNSSATNVPMQVDSEDEDEQVDEEIVVEPNQAVKSSAVPSTSTTPFATPVAKPAVVEPQVKPYKPKVPFPQRLKKDKLKEQYGKFVDMSKSVYINVSLVDLLSGMPNYAKFIKDLITDKRKLEEAKATFLNAECSAIVQNQIPPKLEDPGSFLITCSLDAKLTCDALADIGASIN